MAELPSRRRRRACDHPSPEPDPVCEQRLPQHRRGYESIEDPPPEERPPEKVEDSDEPPGSPT